MFVDHAKLFDMVDHIWSGSWFLSTWYLHNTSYVVVYVHILCFYIPRANKQAPTNKAYYCVLIRITRAGTTGNYIKAKIKAPPNDIHQLEVIQ